MASALPLSPTFYGHIASTRDALLLFEACLSGALKHVARRPYDREWVSLIKSGNVFIYEEHSSGIKRWSDGMPWGPSRSLDSPIKETECSLIGSVEEEGLVKKTVSVTVGAVSHYLISYYTVADVINNKFTTPSKDPRFQNITPRPDLVTKQSFRTPIDEVDSIDRMEDHLFTLLTLMLETAMWMKG